MDLNIIAKIIASSRIAVEHESIKLEGPFKKSPDMMEDFLYSGTLNGFIVGNDEFHKLSGIEPDANNHNFIVDIEWIDNRPENIVVLSLDGIMLNKADRDKISKLITEDIINQNLNDWSIKKSEIDKVEIETDQFGF